MNHIDVTPTATPQVEISGLSKTFRRRDGAGDVVPIDDVSLDVAAGEFLVLLGPSGCGKTTLLRSVAGLERPDRGRIRIRDTDVFDASRKLFVAPNRRPISMIFQSYALWPHMTVAQNVAYPIKARRRRAGRAEVAAAVARALDRVGLGNLQNQYPGQLSGGQQQRVALARALITDADVLLFDEPLSNIDAKVREELRAQLVEMQREVGFTALYVTHDQAEAMELADRIAVLNSGRVEQLAPPREVYSRPASRYVAEFVGTANLLTGKVVDARPDALHVDAAIGRVVAATPRDGLVRGDTVSVMFRPEDVRIGGGAAEGENVWPARVVRTSYTGTTQGLVLDSGGERIRATAAKDTVLDEGATVSMGVPAAAVHVFGESRATARTTASTTTGSGS